MAEEVRIEADVELVRRLLAAQAPQWVDLPLTTVASAGVNHGIFRLGEHLTVRVPQSEWVANHVRKEHRWLPQFVGRLPLEVPSIAAAGVPDDHFPWHWSVYGWLAGREAVESAPLDERATALALADLVRELHLVPTSNGPRAGLHSGLRGTPLPVRDDVVRAALVSIPGQFDVPAATAAWEAALRVPAWRQSPVWIHGDMHPGNLLVREGALSGLVDWEMMCVGDPALDLSGAWMVLSDAGRQVMRNALPLDDHTWARARGWALCIGVIAAAYYHDSNPVLAGFSRKAAEDAVADFVRGW